MKVSAFLTLIAGLVLGFFIGQATRTSTSSSAVAQRPAAPTPPRQRPADATVYRLPVEDSPARGPADALVTLVDRQGAAAFGWTAMIGVPRVTLAVTA